MDSISPDFFLNRPSILLSNAETRFADLLSKIILASLPWAVNYNAGEKKERFISNHRRRIIVRERTIRFLAAPPLSSSCEPIDLFQEGPRPLKDLSCGDDRGNHRHPVRAGGENLPQPVLRHPADGEERNGGRFFYLFKIIEAQGRAIATLGRGLIDRAQHREIGPLRLRPLHLLP